MIRLIQIPFSHNCVKVRCALELKGLDYTTEDIAPMDRSAVLKSSGQGLVPAIEDGDARVHDSTAILAHLEAKYPEPSLLPADPRLHPECWLLEDWADQAFMERTRRLAYWNLLVTPGALEALWFPHLGGLKRWVYRRQAGKALTKRFRLSASRNRKDEEEVPRLASLALARLAGRPFLFGDRPTVADVALATMSAPAAAARRALREDPAVAELLRWGRTVMPASMHGLYEASGYQGMPESD